MGTLIIDEDPYSRNATRSLLLANGHGPVLDARNPQEARHFLDREAGRLGLILASWRPDQGMDLPLARILLAHAALDPVPFVLTLQDRPALGFIRRTGRFSRVDAQLYKPFGDKGLHEAVREARRHRAGMRSTLVLAGARFQSELASALLFSRGDHHWTELRAVSSPGDLRRELDRDPFRIGGVLLDPGSWSEADSRWFRWFKRTPQGLVTPLACLSQDMGEIREFRLCCDLFQPAPSEWRAASPSPREIGDPRLGAWNAILSTLSRRLLQDWEIRQDLSRFRTFLREGKVRNARRCLDRALRADPDRWECHEASGDLFRGLGRSSQALASYQRAVKANPCSPRAWLGILGALPPGKRAEAARRAVGFCPRHPAIRRISDP